MRNGDGWLSLLLGLFFAACLLIAFAIFYISPIAAATQFDQQQKELGEICPTENRGRGIYVNGRFVGCTSDPTNHRG